MRDHKIIQIAGKLFDGERRAAPRGLPVPPGIRRDDAVTVLKIRNLMLKIGTVAPIAVQKNQRFAAPLFPVI